MISEIKTIVNKTDATMTTSNSTKVRKTEPTWPNFLYVLHEEKLNQGAANGSVGVLYVLLKAL